jgi:hypothetical protein
MILGSRLKAQGSRLKAQRKEQKTNVLFNQYFISSTLFFPSSPKNIIITHE